MIDITLQLYVPLLPLYLMSLLSRTDGAGDEFIKLGDLVYFISEDGACLLSGKRFFNDREIIFSENCHLICATVFERCTLTLPPSCSVPLRVIGKDHEHSENVFGA